MAITIGTAPPHVLCTSGRHQYHLTALTAPAVAPRRADRPASVIGVVHSFRRRSPATRSTRPCRCRDNSRPITPLAPRMVGVAMVRVEPTTPCSGTAACALRGGDREIRGAPARPAALARKNTRWPRDGRSPLCVTKPGHTLVGEAPASRPAPRPHSGSADDVLVKEHDRGCMASARAIATRCAGRRKLVGMASRLSSTPTLRECLGRSRAAPCKLRTSPVPCDVSSTVLSGTVEALDNHADLGAQASRSVAGSCNGTPCTRTVARRSSSPFMQRKQRALPEPDGPIPHTTASRLRRSRCRAALSRPKRLVSAQRESPRPYELQPPHQIGNERQQPIHHRDGRYGSSSAIGAGHRARGHNQLRQADGRDQESP